MVCEGRGVIWHDAPAIIVLTESDSGLVVHVAGIERCADFIERNPLPREFNVGQAALLADAGDADQFSSRDWNGKCGLVRVLRRNEGANRVDAGRA